MPFESWEPELKVAIEVARRAGEVALHYQRRGVVAEAKADLSPVTEADRECERLIVTTLRETFPDDGLLGEEGAEKESPNGRRWIIDPIDGTRDFVRGTRMWAVLLALEAEGDVVVGVEHFPALGDTYYATRGGGAFLDEEPIRVSAIAEPSQAVLCINDIGSLAGGPLAAELLHWMERFWAVRNPGGSPCAMRVASGQAEAFVEPHAHPWDLAACKVITEEAGGRFFNFNGGSSIQAGSCVTCNRAMEDELRRFVVRGAD